MGIKMKVLERDERVEGEDKVQIDLNHWYYESTERAETFISVWARSELNPEGNLIHIKCKSIMHGQMIFYALTTDTRVY